MSISETQPTIRSIAYWIFSSEFSCVHKCSYQWKWFVDCAFEKKYFPMHSSAQKTINVRKLLRTIYLIVKLFIMTWKLYSAENLMVRRPTAHLLMPCDTSILRMLYFSQIDIWPSIQIDFNEWTAFTFKCYIVIPYTIPWNVCSAWGCLYSRKCYSIKDKFLW